MQVLVGLAVIGVSVTIHLMLNPFAEVWSRAVWGCWGGGSTLC